MQIDSNNSFLDNLYTQLFESGIICEYCRLSEEMLRCDILVSQTKCQKSLCVHCYKSRKDDLCQCGFTFQEHFIKEGKIKTAIKAKFKDECEKLFYKEQKIRKHEQFQHLDNDLVNIAAYLHMNTNSQSNRVSYYKMEQTIKKTTQEKRKQEEMLLRKKSTRKKAVYIHREKNQLLDGYLTCGYDTTYTKGFNLVFKAFKVSEPTALMKTQKVNEEEKPEMISIEQPEGKKPEKAESLEKDQDEDNEVLGLQKLSKKQKKDEAEPNPKDPTE